VTGTGLDDASVMMAASDAEPHREDSSILTPKAHDEGTSVLDMGALRKDDGTSVLDMGSVTKQRDPSMDIGRSGMMEAAQDEEDQTLLGMGKLKQPEGAAERIPLVIPSRDEIDEPDPSDSPMLMVLPGTRRSTIQA